MSTPGDPNQKPRMEGDTAPLLVAREYMESIGMAPTEEAVAPGQAKSTRPLMDPAQFKRAMDAAMLKAEKLFSGTEARIELLVQSLQARKVSIPGVPNWPLRHPVSANGKNIITYLSKRYAHVPTLEKDVVLACSRFWEFVQVLDACRQANEAGSADDALLEELKLKTYFVANFYDHFKEDPLLCQLYPPPPDPPKARTGPVSATDAISRYRQARENAVRKAEAYLKGLAPAVERVKQLQTLGKQDRGAALLGMLNPRDMRERALVKRLRDAKLLGKLDEFLALVDTATNHLPKAREGAPYEPMDNAINELVAMQSAWAATPGLNEVIPRP